MYRTKNNMLKKIIVLLILIFPIMAYSQGGSNYSIIGIGDINYVGNAAYAGVSGTSIAMPLENGINFRNPAMWSMATNTRLQAGYRFTQNYVNNTDNSLFQNNGNINGINSIFSIDTALGISAAFGLVPYSNINYYTASPYSLSIDDLSVSGKAEYKGSGGLNMVYLGGSTKVINNLYFGASVYAAFGTVNSNIDNLVNNAEANYNFNTRISSQKFLNGWGFKTGVYYKITNQLSFGAFFDKMSSLNVEDSTFNYRLSTVGLTKVETDEFNIEMPSMYGFGLSYQTGKFLLGADFAMQDFSNFNYNPAPNSEFTNSMYINFGVVRLGNKSYSADFADKITYKFGFSYKDLYYQIGNEQINDISASLGIALPVPQSFQFDMGIVFGRRGTTNLNLVQEYYGQFTFDVSIGEIWFKPFKREFE